MRTSFRDYFSHGQLDYIDYLGRFSYFSSYFYSFILFKILNVEFYF